MTTRRDPARARLLPALALAGALLTACSSAPGAAPAVVSPAPTAGVGAAAATSRGAELEAALTAVLVERVHALSAAASGRAGAVAALDASSEAVTEVLSAGYTEARAPLLAALRACDEAVVDRSSGCETDLDVALTAVVPRLDAAQRAGRLPTSAVAGYPALRRAGAAARSSARVLAGAVAADRHLGETATPAATLRADLTWLLVEHVLLATAQPTPQDRAALSANGADLVDLLGRAYPDLRAPLRRTWSAHLDRLTTWSASFAAGDSTRTATLRRAVSGLTGDLSRLLATHVDGLPADRLAQEVGPALDSELRAATAVASGRTDAASQRRRAVEDVLAPAALIAAAVAEDRGLD